MRTLLMRLKGLRFLAWELCTKAVTEKSFSVCIYIYIYIFFFFSLRIGYLKPHGPFHTPPPTQASGRGGSDKIDPIIHCSFAILLLALGRKKKNKTKQPLNPKQQQGRQHAQPCPGWA